MKIKTERQVRLDELIKHIFDNDIKEKVIDDVIVDVNGAVLFDEWLTRDDLFTITEEVEIDEETPLNLVVVDDENEVTGETDTKISTLKREAETFDYEFKFIYLQNADGSIGELIWSKERGLVD